MSQLGDIAGPRPCAVRCYPDVTRDLMGNGWFTAYGYGLRLTVYGSRPADAGFG